MNYPWKLLRIDGVEYEILEMKTFESEEIDNPRVAEFMRQQGKDAIAILKRPKGKVRLIAHHNKFGHWSKVAKIPSFLG